jgi:regulator of sigma E protease
MPHIIIFILVLSVLVISHEFGHFIVAKKSGMRVLEFGFGFPPRVFSITRGGTRYSINLIPFGGFVKIFGEDGIEDEGGEKSKKFTDFPRLTQSAVIIAGVVMNLLLAWFLFTLGYITGFPVPVGADTPYPVTNERILVTGVLPDSPASEAKIQNGSVIKKLISQDKILIPKTGDDVSKFISESSNAVTFTLITKGKEETITVTPKDGLVSGKRGVGISMDVVGTMKVPPHLALIEGAKTTYKMSIATATGLGTLLYDAVRGKAQLASVSGPIGIYSLLGDVSELGFVYILTFTALLSVTLAVINIVPFPALDGGRLLFIIIEAIRGKPLRENIIAYVHYAGFMLLLLLMVLITYGDLAKLGLFS